MPLAQALVMDGYSVNGSTTTPEKLERLSEERIRPFLVDLSKDILPEDFLQGDFLIINIPPRSRTGDVGEYLRQMNLTAHKLRSSPVRRVVFISSTAVYPDLNRTVNEDDADPSSALYKAERIFLNMKSPAITVIRFAGLVGPGRHPGKFLSGRTTGGATAPVNIIHLDDCVGIVRKTLKAKIDEHVIFNACADLHPTRKEYYSKMAELLNLPAPVFNDSDIAFKIIDNSRLKKILEYEFIHKDPMQMDFQ
jgi:nucleoside-diphosphate-sugar epimerase